MAKHKDDDDKQTPSNTTSGGKHPHEAKGPADIGKKEGTAVYPPSPSDSSGEKTDNVPPSKRLPADPPPEENPAAGQTVTTASAAIAQADQSITGLQARVAELEAELTKHDIAVPGKAVPRAKGGKQYRVFMPGHAEPTLVDADDERGAIAAAQQKHGTWGLPTAPVVEEVK